MATTVQDDIRSTQSLTLLASWDGVARHYIDEKLRSRLHGAADGAIERTLVFGDQEQLERLRVLVTELEALAGQR